MKKILILLLSFIVTVSCTKKQESDALVIGVMPSMDWLPLAVAQREGYFNRTEVNVTIHRFYSANERDAAFQSGNIDGTVIDYTGAVLQSAGGIDLKVVSKCDAPFYIVAGKNSGVKTVADLRDKKVAVSQNTVIDYLVDMALFSARMDSTAVEKVEINMIPLRFELLQNNKIDATGLPDPLALRAILEGDVLLTTNTDLDLAITGIMFTSKSLNSKKENILKMYEAYDMGVEYIKSNPLENISDILINDMQFNKAILPHVKLPDYTKAQPPRVEDFDYVANWLEQRGLIAAFDSQSIIGDILTQ